MIEMCEMTQTSNGTISDEQIKKIIERSNEQKSTDYAYFLRISQFKNLCTDPVYEEVFDTLYGTVKIIKIDEFEDQCKKETEYVLIPETPQVVIGLFQKQKGVKLIRVYTFNFHRGWFMLEV